MARCGPEPARQPRASNNLCHHRRPPWYRTQPRESESRPSLASPPRTRHQGDTPVCHRPIVQAHSPLSRRDRVVGERKDLPCEGAGIRAHLHPDTRPPWPTTWPSTPPPAGGLCAESRTSVCALNSQLSEGSSQLPIVTGHDAAAAPNAAVVASQPAGNFEKLKLRQPVVQPAAGGHQE